MGKLTLLLVVAASLGGAYLTLNMQGLLGAGAERHSADQQDLLAREIAESGHDLILASMMGSDGFRTPTSGSLRGELDGGRYDVAYQDSVLPERAVITARGMYGGAEHVINSEHEFEAMQYPGPIWIDVPYATVEAEPGAQVSGGASGPGIRYDRRQNDQYRLGSFLPASDVENDLTAVANDTGSNYKTTGSASTAESQWNALLDDLNVRDAEELFEAAKGAATETKAGPLTLTATETWGAGDPTAVTLVDGDLTIPNGGRLSGTGALVVDGGLEMTGSSRLDWVGMVIVRSTDAVMPVQLGGNRARITGALVIVQRSFPPGGHLDVTVNRDPSGLSTPVGDKTGGPARWANPLFTWYQHTHEFDIKPLAAPRGKRVRFLQGGAAGPHEDEVRFQSLLATLGSTPVYLEFDNETRHGFAQYELDVDGMSEPLVGGARDGFGSFARGSGGNRFRTQTFGADQLNDFSVEVMALRSLQARFDGVPAYPASGSCRGDQWPFCVGESWDREGAFTVELKTASGSTLYNASLYWHMRADEVADHEAEEQAWRDAIAAGAGYGAHIKLGNGTRVAYNRAVILQLADRLGFDGNRIIKRAFSHETHSASEPSRGRGADGLYTVCHRANNTTLRVGQSDMEDHMSHYDSRGACPSTSTPAGGTGGTTTSAGPTGGTTGGSTTGGSTTGGTGGPAGGTTGSSTTGGSTTGGSTGGSTTGGGTTGGGTTGSGTATGTPVVIPTTIPGFCSNPLQLVKVCRPPSGGDTSWNDFETTCADAARYLIDNPGALAGTCSDNGR